MRKKREKETTPSKQARVVIDEEASLDPIRGVKGDFLKGLINARRSSPSYGSPMAGRG